jgi:hypothetical protein
MRRMRSARLDEIARVLQPSGLLLLLGFFEGATPPSTSARLSTGSSAPLAGDRAVTARAVAR